MSEQQTGPWVAVRDRLRPPPCPWIICRDQPEAFNGCEVFTLERGGPAIDFPTQAEAEAVARLLRSLADPSGCSGGYRAEQEK